MSNKLGDYLHGLRSKENLSLRDFSNKLGISHTYLDKLEKGYDPRNGKPVAPTVDTVNQIADSLKMPREELMRIAGFIESEPAAKNLTARDERDIEKILQQTRSQLESQDGLMFDGDPASPEAIESILAAMEVGLRLAKENNKKYTPKKYRK